MTPPPGLPAKLEHFIGGSQTASADGATSEAADPVTNQPYATVASGGAADIDREGGPHSLEFYTESRIVHIPLGDTRVPRFGA